MFYFPFDIEQSLVSLTCDTFVVYSYKYQHDDGRVSYPLCFIFSSPVGKKKNLFKIEKFNMHKLSNMKQCYVSNSLKWNTFPGCKPEQQMMYAGSKNKLVQTVELTKVKHLTLHPVMFFL